MYVHPAVALAQAQAQIDALDALRQEASILDPYDDEARLTDIRLEISELEGK